MTARQDILDRLEEMRKDGVTLVMQQNTLIYAPGSSMAGQAKHHQWVQCNRNEIVAVLLEDSPAHRWIKSAFPGAV